MAEIIGVTGGIGAGKSTVLQILGRLGCQTLDCDAVVHQLYEPGEPLVDALVNRWGPQIRDGDGRVCRPAVAEKVFDRPEELAWLNNHVHPAVKRFVLKVADRTASPLFCAIPLLFEVGWQRETQSVWAVWCDTKNQYERLLARGLTRMQISHRLNSQISMDDKLNRADYGLINTGSRENLKRQILRLLERLESSR